MNDPKKPLNILVGKELSSIEFVRDYIQFRFDGPCLTAVTDPFILVKNIRYDRSEESFCNILLKFIGLEVAGALLIENEILRISFSEEKSINISLKSTDYVTAEAVKFDDGSGKWWIW